MSNRREQGEQGPGGRRQRVGRGERRRFRPWLVTILLAGLGGCQQTQEPKSTGVVEGTVTVDGEPEAGITVQLVNPANNDVLTKTTNSNGAYQFDAAGPRIVRIQTPVGMVCEPPMHELELEPGETTTADFACTTITGELVGRVTVNGLPVAGVQISLLFPILGALRETTTDANGRYEFGDLIGGEDYTVSMQPPPGATCDRVQETFTVAAATTIVDFHCSGAFSGTVQTCVEHTQPGVYSTFGSDLGTDPAQPGASFTINLVGPQEGGNSGVLPGQVPVDGTLDPEGKAFVGFQINRFGTYVVTWEVLTVFGVRVDFNAQRTVGATEVPCA